MLLNYHISRFVLGSLCVGDLVRLGLSGVRVEPATRTPEVSVTSFLPFQFFVFVRLLESNFPTHIKM